MIIDPYTWTSVKIVAVNRVASDTYAIRLKRPGDFRFRAGQYSVVRIILPNGEQRIRQYSFSSSPETKEYLEMLIQREPSGDVSNWFCKVAAVNDEIELSQALGGFVLNDMTRPTVLIAGKVGMAPFLSMLREASHPALSLIYNVRNENQVCYPEELQLYNTGIIETSKHKRLNVSSLEQFVTNNPVFYICGSKQFVDSVTEMLTSINVPMVDIYRELFTLQ